jgi:hypothetical protein
MAAEKNPENGQEFPAHLQFTEPESKELGAHPIGSIEAPLPPERFAVRLGAAKKMYGRVQLSGWFLARPQRIKDAMLKYPLWGFYTDPKHPAIARRAEGVCEYKDGNLGLHMASAIHFPMANDVIGGVPVEEVQQVDNWSDEQLKRIATCGARRAFYDPCGFVLLGGPDE